MFEGKEILYINISVFLYFSIHLLKLFYVTFMGK